MTIQPVIIFISLPPPVVRQYYTIIDFGMGCYISGFINLKKKCNIHRAAVGEYTFLKVYKPDGNLFQSQWLFYFMTMFYYNLLFYFMTMFYYNLLTTSSSFWAFVYDSAENAITLVIGQWKNEFDIKSTSPPQLLCLARVISLSRHRSGSIFSREGEITSTQNLSVFSPSYAS